MSYSKDKGFIKQQEEEVEETIKKDFLRLVLRRRK